MADAAVLSFIQPGAPPSPPPPDSASDDDVAKSRKLYFESKDLRNKYKSSGNIEGLKSATRLCEQALELLPNSLVCREHLAVCLRTEYQWTKDLATAAKVIRIREEVLAATPADNRGDRARRLNDLACILGNRYEYESSESDYSESMRNFAAAIELNPKPQFCYNRSITNNCKWMKSDDLANLSSAIESARGGVQPSDSNLARQLTYSSWLGDLLMQRFEQTNSREDLDEAIALAERVSNDTSWDDPSWPDRGYRYGNRLLLRLEVTLDPNDLHEGMYNLQRATEMTPADSPMKQERLERFQDVVEVMQSMRGLPPMNERIHLQVERLESMKDEDPDKGMAACRLAMDFQKRYDQRNVLEDLREATKWLEEAAKHMEMGSFDRQQVIYRMAHAYYKLYLDDENLRHLDKAVDAGREAVEIIQVRNSGAEGENEMRARALDCLARCLEDRYNETEVTLHIQKKKVEDQALPDLIEAERHAEEALELIGPAVDRDQFVHNLEGVRQALARHRTRVTSS